MQMVLIWYYTCYLWISKCLRDYFKKQCGSNSSTVPAVYLLYLLRQGSETFIYVPTLPLTYNGMNFLHQ